MCKCPFPPLGGDNSANIFFPWFLEFLSMEKCFRNHNGKLLFQQWHAITLDELAHVNSSSDTCFCSSRRWRGFWAFVYAVLSCDGGRGGGSGAEVQRRTMMTCEKRVMPVPTVLCDWAGSSPAARMVGLSGWSTEGVIEGGMRRRRGGSAVRHTVRTCCRHQATSQICVWNLRSIRMGSTIKGTKGKRWRGRKKKERESFRAEHESEECFHICRRLWVLSDRQSLSRSWGILVSQRDSDLSTVLLCLMGITVWRIGLHKLYL